MKPTTELMYEHQAILRMLGVMDKIRRRLDQGQEVSPVDLERIVEFIRVFADTCHHGKEEDLLFVEMEKAGIPRQGGPIGVMEQEHEAGRGYVAGLAAAVERYKAGDPQASEAIVENARRYVSLLSLHINNEDNVLYPLADESLSDAQQSLLEAGFEKIEQKKIGPGKHEEFHLLIEELEKKYSG